MTSRRYIAVIDDDESLCRSLARLLHQSGFHAITFSSAEEFLADPLRVHFGCLLVDIQLGGMSGIELNRALKSNADTTPVIFITAFDDSRTRAEAAQTGCAGYFRKTDGGSEILAAIQRAIVPPTPS